MPFVRSILATSLLVACGTPGEGVDSTTRPLVGVSATGDGADRQCHIVLRQVGRVPDGCGGYQTSELGNWIWDGTLDVSAAAAAEGALPSVVYQYGSDPNWYEVYGVAEEATPGADGFVRYGFRLEDHLPGPGMSGTALVRARVQLVPALHLPGGGRAFDHNRRRGDFDSYELGVAGYFSIGDDASVCPPGSAPQPPPPVTPPPPAPAATLRFRAGWSTSQDGPVVQGGQLTVAYELARLGACRGTHNGYPAWDVVAHARFAPGGQLVQASVRGFETMNGIPTTSAYAIPARFDVPADATSVELWFENAGLWCQAWDSNLGQNYRFDVVARPS